MQLKPRHVLNRARVEERNMRRFKRALAGSGIRLMRPIRDRYSAVDFRLIANRQVPNYTFAFSFPISDYVIQNVRVKYGETTARATESTRSTAVATIFL